MGTSLTEEQAKLLRRYADKVIICMDSDEAGRRAAERAAGILLETGFAVNIAPLPPGEDPDSFIQKEGGGAFGDLLKASEPAYGYVLGSVAANHDLSRPTGKRSALKELLPMLNRIADPIERSHAITETSRTLGIEEQVVAAEAGRARENAPASPAEQKSIKIDWLPVAERQLLIAATRDPHIALQAVEEMEISSALTDFSRRILEALTGQDAEGKISYIASLSDMAQNEEEKQALAALAIEAGREEPASALECASAIAISALNRQIAELSDRITKLEAGEHETFDSLHAEKILLKRKVISLERRGRIALQHPGDGN